jgi:hypothetical protein
MDGAQVGLVEIMVGLFQRGLQAARSLRQWRERGRGLK